MDNLKILRKPALAGVVASEADLRAIRGFESSVLDLYELRIDILEPASEEFKTAVSELVLPAIVTVRDPLEGGVNALSEERRLQLLQEWLPFSAFIDLELKNLSAFSGLLDRARALGTTPIVSVHTFHSTPDLEDLERDFEASKMVGEPRIFKIASHLRHWEDLVTLSRFLQAHPEDDIAVMGMGPLGKLSRLVFAELGSILAYVALGETVAAGQWHFEKFSQSLAEIRR